MKKVEVSEIPLSSIKDVYDWSDKIINNHFYEDEGDKNAWIKWQVAYHKFISQFMDETEWVYRNPAKIIKRIKKWFHDNIPELGWEDRYTQKLNSLLGSGGIFNLEYRKQSDWEDGEFGDSDSCFWTTYREVFRAWLDERDDFEWVVFIDDNGKGTGRAILWHYNQDTTVIFNCYGHNAGQVSEVLAIDLDRKYKHKVNVYCNDPGYMNSTSNWVLTNDSDFNWGKSLNIPMKRSDLLCKSCGEEFPTYDEYFHTKLCYYCYQKRTVCAITGDEYQESQGMNIESQFISYSAFIHNRRDVARKLWDIFIDKYSEQFCSSPTARQWFRQLRIEITNWYHVNRDWTRLQAGITDLFSWCDENLQCE